MFSDKFWIEFKIIKKKYNTWKECNQKAHLEETFPSAILNLEIHK